MIDGCHNPSAAKVISNEMIKKNIKDGKDLLIILGIKKNKNLEDFIVKFNEIAKEITFVPIEGNISSSLSGLGN